MATATFKATDVYAPDYFTARRRFVDACARFGWRHQSFPIDAPSPTGEPLTIDVGMIGANEPRTALVASSGVHGVEATFGSAVQLAFMESLADWGPPDGAAMLMLHTLNPFGCAWRRRFNEDNVDLNRNFLLENQEYAGAPPLSGTFRSVLSPASFHRRLRFWPARMALLAIRHGMGSFWQTMPVGQYDYPDWLFFGGRARSQTAEILERTLPGILEEAAEVVHLDFHTGLGRWAECELLLGDGESGANRDWWHEHYRDCRVRETVAASKSYAIRGGFGAWLQNRFPRSIYRYAVAEFGTYSPRRVIEALAEELHWYLQIGTEAQDHWSRRRLANVFVPEDPKWREKTLATGLKLLIRATTVLWKTPH